jgi:hypothetical protein
MNYFYNAKDKKLELAQVESGRRPIDEIMIPHIKRINKLPGVFTCACCGGHRKEENKGSFTNNGYVFICLDRWAYNKIMHKNIDKIPYDMLNSMVLVFNNRCGLGIYFNTKSPKETNKRMSRIHRVLRGIL